MSNKLKRSFPRTFCMFVKIFRCLIENYEDIDWIPLDVLELEIIIIWIWIYSLFHRFFFLKNIRTWY